MDNLLSGLDKLGLNPNSFNTIYDNVDDVKTEKDQARKEAEDRKTEAINEAEYLFDKTITCPICGKQFKTKVVRTGKARLIGTDTDLKPIYAGFEPLKYDVIACLHCGYAATSKAFGHITPGQAKMIKENISSNFCGMTNGSGIYSFMDAIDRHKLALANVIAMKGKNSERAYLCLKIGWLYRSMSSRIPGRDPNALLLKRECDSEEKKFIQSAYEGFSVSYAKELPPICGMDINTLACLLADLARRCKDYDTSLRYIS